MGRFDIIFFLPILLSLINTLPGLGNCCGIGGGAIVGIVLINVPGMLAAEGKSKRKMFKIHKNKIIQPQ